MSPLREPVLIVHHVLPPSATTHSAESDAGVLDEVKAVAAALEQGGTPHRIASITSLSDLIPILGASPEKVVFNLVENLVPRTEDAALVPAVCRTFGKTVTGNDTACQALCLDKWRTKAVLSAAGLPVPRGVCVPPGAAVPRTGLPRGRLMVKPLFTDASEGIDARSVVPGPGRKLAAAVRRVHRAFGQPAVVEQFFGTRELNVSLLERDGALVALPAAEIEFRGFGAERPRIVDYKAKWSNDSFEYRNTVRVVPAPLPARIARQVEAMARAAWVAAGCRDYARVDFRMTASGRLAILEINPNPDIAPDAGFAAALKAAGIPFEAFVRAMCRNAAARAGAATAASPRPRPPAPGGRAPSAIRWTRAEDRDAIVAFTRDTAFFLPGEITVATEVLDEAIKAGAEGHYQSFTLLDDGKPAGWVCYGPTPCTVGTYDIYWIAVSPRSQGRGFGRALLQHAEAEIRKREGRLVLLETSGRPLYQTTRGFYLAAGYEEVARVPEFYTPGDDRVVYAKYLNRTAP